MASRATQRRRVTKRTKHTKRRAARRPEGREKRGTSRIQPFVVACRVHVGKRTLNAYLTDLSARGARVSSDEKVAAGVRTVVIEARLARGGLASRLQARIRWRKAGRRKAGEAAVFGVTFTGIGRAEQARLRSVVRDFRRRAALVA